MKSLCYLGTCDRGTQQAVKRALLRVPGVFRITDHGPHIKINTAKRLPAVRHLKAVQVPDKTTHWDVAYWDFAMAAFRRATTKRQAPHRVIGVMLHYLCNLFGVPESELLDMLAAERRYLERAVTDEEAHGWEMRALNKARR
jgi:hypothetical protein